MAERVRSQYTNLVKLRLDQQSIKRTRKQIRSFRSEVAKMMKIPLEVKGLGVPKTSSPRASSESTTRRPRSYLQDSHVKMYKDQQKFNTLQQDSIENFMVSNRLIRESSPIKQKAYRQQLMQTNSAKELRLEMRKIKAGVADEYNARKRLVRESEKQLAVQQRFNASITQMIGSLGSVYAMTTLIGSSIQTGMQMEGMEKSFKVVSGSSQLAAENMAWVREEAMRLGTPLLEASRSFSNMIAAAGNKMALDELKETFTGVNEAGVALGLSQDDLTGAFRAVQQMMSRLLGI